MILTVIVNTRKQLVAEGLCLVCLKTEIVSCTESNSTSSKWRLVQLC